MNSLNFFRAVIYKIEIAGYQVAYIVLVEIWLKLILLIVEKTLENS